MVTYIRSDLDFILEQIRIAEAHAAGQPLFGPGGLLPTYNLSFGLRTVDGTYNNVLHPEWGAADNEFPEPLGTEFRTVMVDVDPGPGVTLMPVSYTPGVDNDGPGPAVPSFVIDPSVRTISNLIVDQTLGNPAAILTGLQRAGIDDPGMAITASISAAYEPLRPLFEDLADAQRAYAAASAAASASPLNPVLQQAAADALFVVQAAEAALTSDPAYGPLTALLADNGIELQGDNVHIPNVAPDEGLSAPFNSWFTLFGQFFDHGLDLVAKGGNSTVFIPLMPDDPLFNPAPGSPNFMVLTRATLAGPGADGVLGDDLSTPLVNEGLDDTDRPVNTTTSFVDQNQTYASHPAHQVFLRQYVLNAAGDPVETGKLIEGTNSGMATWANVKAQAADLLGIQLLDSNVGNVPLLATDPYGNFIRGANGYPQLVTSVGLIEGNPAANGGLGVLVDDLAAIPPYTSIRTGHAFLADIAHNAVPNGLADGDIEIGLDNPGNLPGIYDNELLDAHFMAGDGRVNENIGLTAVHHVFHSEHNRLVDHTQSVVIADAAAMLAGGATQAQAVAFLNEWLVTDVAAVPVGAAAINALIWDGDRLFQAAKFGTEMQYQHLVFEEFARKIQPQINPFLVPDGFDVTINPTIVAEFAHVVYRFGHSMLTESIDRFDPTFTEDHIGLIEGFLNPLQFQNNGTTATVDADIAAGSIIRGMTRQVGNHIDEFVTSALRNNLLGLPLDLATINLARGRDTGVPSLNSARADFYAATNNAVELKPYESWVDFAGHLKNEASIINFIAAYGTHSLITSEETLEGKRAATLAIIFGTPQTVFAGTPEERIVNAPLDAVDFLYATGAYAGGSLGGLNNVDLWIGGLAEQTMPFGGMLGSTFNFVFEQQMESLQNGDRFYYLQRLDGLHLFGEMENNSFASMIMRNTNATHLPSDVFSAPGLILEVDQTRQFNDLDGDGTMESTDPVGGGILTQLVVRNDPSTVGPDTHYLRYTGDEHVILGGTDASNTLIAGIGDDTLFGDGGNDKMQGGFGNDIINGGDGDDIIRDDGGDDNIKAGSGNDVVHAGPGLDLVMGGAGQDFIFLGTDAGSEVFAGEGNDFVLGNKNAERILGNEGNDWIETGTFDGAPGDNFDEIFAQDGIDGHDVFLGDGGFDEFIGEGGDDIMVGSPGRGKMAGMSGFDWATYKDNVSAVNADLSIPIIFDEAPVPPQNAALDEFELIEGLSGSRFNDVLKGSEDDATAMLPLALGGSSGFLGSALDLQGIQLIAGLQGVLGTGVTSFAAGDIILGGDGSDLIQGNGGDDIIDGDKWLNVRIAVFAAGDTLHTGTPIAYHNSMTTLAAAMFAGTINPGQLGIVREIMTDTTPGDIDTAMYRGQLSEYAFFATADGQLIVRHAIEGAIDGTDRLRGIEKIQFANGGPLNIIIGTEFNDNGLAPQGLPPLNQPVLNGTSGDDLILGLAGADILNGLAGNDILVGGPGSSTGTYRDEFGIQAYTNNYGTLGFNGGWTEGGGETTSATAGDIQVNTGSGGRLHFNDGVDGGEFIQRAFELTGATSASVQFTYVGDTSITGTENVTVQAWDHTTNSFQTLAGGVLQSASGTFNVNLSAAQIGPQSAIRLMANGDWDGGDDFFIDNFTVTAGPGLNAGVDILNGGLGDDTYSFTVGDGNDIINELANEGSADRISILAPSTGIDPETGLPILTINALNASDNDGDNNDGDLVINYTLPTGAAQTITVAGHYDGTNAQTGVERINFNDAVYRGYQLGAADYLISRLDFNRDAGGVNLSASTANNFIAGEDGVADLITGGSGNDLIFGGTGNNNIVGGLGDDLLVGSTGNDSLDARTNGDDADPEFVGELGADTMVGGGGTDTYGVDDLLDVVVEEAGGGTDTVQTFMAALSIENMANVENLTYLGLDGDQFVGTGNTGNNVITGGDLADTLNGLAGNDQLNGGLGADILNGGDNNDTLNGGDDNDILNGDAGTDTLNGGDGDDTLNGGIENDTLNGDAGNDILDGGLGNDAMDGEAGDDIYFADSTTDTVNEDAGDGTDLVQFTSTTAGATYTITDADVENLTLLGAANINGTGNGSANVITGNSGNNTLNGAGGNDTLIGGLGDDLLIGGTGTDAASYAGAAAGVTVSLSLATAQVTGGAGTDTLNTIENLTGSAFADTLTASGTAAIGVANLLTGGGGSDTLIATVDNVRDTMDGGDGSDTANYAAYLAALTVNLASGAPIVVGGSGTTLANSDVLVSIENFTGGSGADNITGTTGANVLNGGLGADTFNYVIGGGADTIIGGDGADTLSITGVANDDVLDVIYNGGPTISGFEGGTVTGVETITANLGGNADSLSYAGSGAGVTVDLANGNNAPGTASGFASVASILNVTGTAQADSLTGNTGSNILIGGGGADSLNGDAGADLLIGGDGADTINTGAANGIDQDIIRFSATTEFGDTVVNFDANGPDAFDDRVEFAGTLNTAWDDGNNNDTFLFASGNGGAGTVAATVGQGNADIEALYLSGAAGEGVALASLADAALVSAAFNSEFAITAANGEDALLVINDTTANSFSLWQWIQAGGGELSATELTHIGTFTANATVTTGNFDFV